jgi:hypothetical protein
MHTGGPTLCDTLIQLFANDPKKLDALRIALTVPYEAVAAALAATGDKVDPNTVVGIIADLCRAAIEEAQSMAEAARIQALSEAQRAIAANRTTTLTRVERLGADEGIVASSPAAANMPKAVEPARGDIDRAQTQIAAAQRLARTRVLELEAEYEVAKSALRRNGGAPQGTANPDRNGSQPAGRDETTPGSPVPFSEFGSLESFVREPPVKAAAE